MLIQYEYSVKFRKTHEHGNVDALSHLPVGGDHQFHVEEMGEDVDNICTVSMISRQIIQDDSKLLVKETNKDPVLTQVMCCVKEGWPTNVQTSSRITRNWKTPFPLNMVNYSLCQGL